MKNFILVILLSSFFTTSVGSVTLAPETHASVFEHLSEVNNLWLHTDIENLGLSECISFENDADRIQLHLILVQELLNQKNVRHLTDKQREKRQHHLAILADYFTGKHFPINTNHEKRRPYFVDKYGTACAVGYLLLQDKQGEFVSKIVSDNNFAYLLEMNYPELNKWAEINGFTKSELALIQPGYAPAPAEFQPIGNNLGVDGKINELLTSPDDELMYMCGDFDVVDGETGYNSIAAWDGEVWSKLGEGVIGEILDMHIDLLGNLYVVGDFIDPNNSGANNVAIWDGATWEFPQASNFNGSVHTVYATSPSNVFVGGDFTMIDGQPMSYLSFLNFNGEWSDIEGRLTINGPVYEIEPVGNNLLLGGDFTKTNPDMNPNAAQLDVKNLVYWNSYDWAGGFEEEAIGTVTSLDFINGNLYVAGALDDESYYSVLEGGLWTHVGMDNALMDTLGTNYEIAGSIAWDDRVLMYGGFRYFPFVGDFGNGLIDVTDIYPAGKTIFIGGGVAGSAVFQDELYFAGDFYEVGSGNFGTNFSCNNLCKTTFSPITSVDPIDVDEKQVKIYYAPTAESLNIEYEQLDENSVLTVYDIGGREILQEVLDQNNNVQSIDLSHLPKGAYAVGVLGDGVLESEVIAVW